MISIIICIELLKLYFLLCSLCGFANAITFKDVTKENIDAVENFVREKMPQILEQHSLPSNEMVHFFGNLYASMPTQFEFLGGDRILINHLIERVKNLVGSTGNLTKGLALFADKKTKISGKEMFSTPLGFFFGTSSNNGNLKGGVNAENAPNTNMCTTKAVLDVSPSHELKDALFRNINKLISKHLQANSHLRVEFDKDMVCVKTNGTKIYGDVTCGFCKSMNNETNTFRIAHSKYWINSNFKKHLQTVHSIASLKKAVRRKSVAESNQKLELDIETLEEDEIVDQFSSQLDNNVGNKSPNEIEDLEILETETDTQESVIYFQICRQVTKLIGATLKNNDKEENVTVFFDDGIRSEINVTKVQGDGGCLFYSLAHQLFCHKVNSKEHKEATLKLREEVVDFIKNNYIFFKPLIEERIRQKENKDEVEYLDDKCSAFVVSGLPHPRCWGGSETLLAVSMLYNVNVITFYEGGKCTSTDFNFKNKECLLVAYREYGRQVPDTNQKMNYNHYDSISKIDQKDIYYTMKAIIKTIEFKQSSNIIELDT